METARIFGQWSGNIKRGTDWLPVGNPQKGGLPLKGVDPFDGRFFNCFLGIFFEER